MTINQELLASFVTKAYRYRLIDKDTWGTLYNCVVNGLPVPRTINPDPDEQMRDEALHKEILTHLPENYEDNINLEESPETRFFADAYDIITAKKNDKGRQK